MFSDNDQSVKLVFSRKELEATIFEIFTKMNLSTSTEEAAEILTVDEAAACLKLARQTVYGLVSKRAIPHYKRNKRLYFKRSELLAWIDEGKQSTRSEMNADVMDYLRKNHKR